MTTLPRLREALSLIDEGALFYRVTVAVAQALGFRFHKNGTASALDPHWTTPDGEEVYELPDWPRSVDAVIALAKREMPGWRWQTASDGTAWIYRTPCAWTGEAATPALALLAALLKAKIADMEREEEAA